MADTFDVVRESTATPGRVNTMAFPIELRDRLTAWVNHTPRHTRPYTQDAFPELTPDQQEFLISGTTPEEWDELFGVDGE